jgi:methyl-accepting chemotaxis protein
MIILLIPVGFACLYFSMKLFIQAFILAVLGYIAGEALGGIIAWSSAAAYLLQLGIAAALLLAVSKRAVKIITDTHSFYENINDIFSNANTSTQSLEAAEEILLQGVSSLGAAEEKPEEEPSPSNAAVRTIISNINKTMENAKEIMKYTQTMLKGKGKELAAGDEAIKLEEYSKSSRELIAKLAKHTDKVKENLSLISVMVDETKLLSINAAAEAENAGSGGKGSAIVAMKVEKLADESAVAATHIQELLSSVVNDAENTVEAVAKAYEEVFKSLELINRTVETLIKWLMYKNMK